MKTLTFPGWPRPKQGHQIAPQQREVRNTPCAVHCLIQYIETYVSCVSILTDEIRSRVMKYQNPYHTVHSSLLNDQSPRRVMPKMDSTTIKCSGQYRNIILCLLRTRSIVCKFGGHVAYPTYFPDKRQKRPLQFDTVRQAACIPTKQLTMPILCQLT
jgi:hypothetical protein